MLHQASTLNCKGKLLDLSDPIVMGILNVTSDSFYDGGKYSEIPTILHRVEKMLSEGASIIDIGGMSSRPGAQIIDLEEELQRVIPVVSQLSTAFPEAILSIDTVRSKVATEAVHHGVAIVNDISAGSIDKDMFATVAKLNVPYVLMHMQGTPATMQTKPDYKDVTTEVLDFFIEKLGLLKTMGIKDVVIDPGFGFGKTVKHNFRLLKDLHVFKILERPVLAGISRKSMICKTLEVNPENALTGTIALNMEALNQGAKILRVHDAKEAVETIKMWKALNDW